MLKTYTCNKENVLFFIQKCILTLSYEFFRIFKKESYRPVNWVVGVDETAAIISYVSTALKNSYSVSLSSHPFYNFSYDFQEATRSLLTAPILLGKLLNKADGFFYIWSTGFLISHIDNREFEFNFIKKKNKKIVCFFVGSDIRAPQLMHQYENMTGLENIATYLPELNRKALSDSYADRIKRIAFISETYADAVFTASMDQMSYFSKPTRPFIYFYPDERIIKNNKKFKEIKDIKIVHAPSSPIIKGTQLVRAAIKKLTKEGYKFKYIELTGVSNKIVLDHLHDAHIVLNQFYAFVPGYFGIEAMAAHCALLTSADENIETDLPAGSNQAWLVTKYYQVYDNIKMLLDNPNLIKPIADKGIDWVSEHASCSKAGRKLANILKEL